MRAGAGAPPPASFDDYVISYMGEIIANGVEGSSIWSGTAATGGEFEGFLTATGTGAFIKCSRWYSKQDFNCFSSLHSS